MKNTNLWIVIGLIVIGGAIYFMQPKKDINLTDTQLPPADATLAGPQEPMPASTYDAKAPLSKNKIIMKNGMKIEITKEGSGAEIKNGQTAVMSYTGKLTDGTTFDSNVDPKFQHVEPFTFTLGEGRVIKGWDEGVLGMKVGESRTLTIPADLAYGARGIPGTIPPNATLVFDVTLLGIK